MKTTIKNFTLIFSLFLATNIFPQETSSNLSNEFSFSGGFAVPLDDGFNSTNNSVKSLTGYVLQFDYKLINKNAGLQFSLNYLNSPSDEAYLLNEYHASTVDANNWTSMTGMLKFVLRINALKKKILIDLNVGFGVMQTTYAKQSYTYKSDVADYDEVDYVYSDERNSSAMAFGAGVRVNYKILDDFGFFLNYDYQTANQNYDITTIRFGSSENLNSRETVNIKYSNFTVGFAFFY